MKTILTTLTGLSLGQPRAHGGLAIFPLLTTAPRSGSGYLTLEDALAQGLLTVTEAEESGRVNELKVSNGGSLPVLLLDGEELIGAKQNRIFNLSMLVPAGTAIDVPVSCVEQGRWSYRSAAFAASARAQHASGRARRARAVTESLRTRRSATGDQHDVWRDLQAKAARLDAHSPTGAMSDVFDRHRATIEGYVEPLRFDDGQVGAVFGVSGRIVGLEVFDSPAMCARLLPKVVRGYALDAIDFAQNASQPAASDAQAFIDRVAGAPWQSFQAVGAGESARLDSDGLVGSALAEAERLLHLSAFALA